MSEVTVGNSNEWTPFAERHPVLIARLPNLTSALNTILNRRWSDGELVDTFVFVAGHMAIDDFMEIVTLCGNSEGHGATKILRAMFERVVTLKYLHTHPEEFQRYYNYYWVTKRKMANAIEQTFQKGLMPRKPRRNRRRDILNRTVDIASTRTSLRVGVDEPKDPEPEIEVKQWLELRGVLDEPVRPVDGTPVIRLRLRHPSEQPPPLLPTHACQRTA